MLQFIFLFFVFIMSDTPLIITTLRLSVSRTWGTRTISTESVEWRNLRSQILKRDNNTCQLCKFVGTKYMICDHINGDASINYLSNLRTICPLCDKIRRCGLAGINGYLMLYQSSLTQSEIVRKSLQHFQEQKKVPHPHEIDPNAIYVSDTTINFANLLLHTDYDQLTAEQNLYKGFFTTQSATIFKRCL